MNTYANKIGKYKKFEIIILYYIKYNYIKYNFYSLKWKSPLSDDHLLVVPLVK